MSAPMTAMNATIEKFGYPHTLIAEYESWVVLLRPQQATLGALVLACKEAVTSFGEVSGEACAELARVTRDIEISLAAAFAFDKINYLMLMMVDPHVHFHVLPRYADPRRHGDLEFIDAGWPGPPQLGQVTPTSAGFNQALRAQLLATWPEVGR